MTYYIYSLLSGETELCFGLTYRPLACLVKHAEQVELAISGRIFSGTNRKYNQLATNHTNGQKFSTRLVYASTNLTKISRVEQLLIKWHAAVIGKPVAVLTQADLQALLKLKPLLIGEVSFVAGLTEYQLVQQLIQHVGQLIQPKKVSRKLTGKLEAQIRAQVIEALKRINPAGPSSQALA